jgi:hypothetical protein
MWFMHVMFGLSIKAEELPARGKARHTAKPDWLAHGYSNAAVYVLGTVPRQLGLAWIWQV